jgi:hypothetical protein
MATQTDSHAAIGSGSGARSIYESMAREALKDAMFDAACGYRARVPVGVVLSGAELARRIRRQTPQPRIDIASLDQVPALIVHEPDGAVQVAFE